MSEVPIMSYDTRCARLADIFLSEDAPAIMPNKMYADHAARLAQEIQDCIEMFCGYDTEWNDDLTEQRKIAQKIVSDSELNSND